MSTAIISLPGEHCICLYYRGNDCNYSVISAILSRHYMNARTSKRVEIEGVTTGDHVRNWSTQRIRRTYLYKFCRFSGLWTILDACLWCDLCCNGRGPGRDRSKAGTTRHFHPIIPQLTFHRNISGCSTISLVLATAIKYLRRS